MTSAFLIYPNQLFYDSFAQIDAQRVIILEDPLFFTQYPFHKQKIAYHRASMKAFADFLESKKFSVSYINFNDLKDTKDIAEILKKEKIEKVSFFSLDDTWLEEKLKKALSKESISFNELKHPHFISESADLDSIVKKDETFFFSDFYIQQRKKLHILVETDHKTKKIIPRGGKWSFDSENREKLSKLIHIPSLPIVSKSKYTKEAVRYVQSNFPNNYGICEEILYPITPGESKDWLNVFLAERFASFGPYEDAMLKNQSFLFHSVLTPMLNVGLLSPSQIVRAALEVEAVPLNSKEGFIRQIVGWREFIHQIYLRIGTKQRTKNFLGNTRHIPKSFYSGTTGIDPVDDVIQRILKTGYCHHIERLMVLGNFMLLCDFDPDHVYQWFMELFIDAYDWVMVPNVYGMSQYADGGRMATKPYVSGSSYIRKMSDYKEGAWCNIWDALYWRFIDQNEKHFIRNPRMSMMYAMRNKLKASGVLEKHSKIAEEFLLDFS